jgi:hypothetical protein
MFHTVDNYDYTGEIFGISRASVQQHLFETSNLRWQCKKIINQTLRWNEGWKLWHNECYNHRDGNVAGLRGVGRAPESVCSGI